MQSPIPAYLTAAIAFLVLIVSYRQWKVARDKLRLDLYNRRFVLLDKSVRIYLFAMKGEGDEAKVGEMMMEYVIAVREAQFLFDKNSGVSEAMQIIADESQKMTRYSIARDAGHEAEYRRLLLEERKDSPFEMERQLLNLERCLHPYLVFGAERGWWEGWLLIFK